MKIYVIFIGGISFVIMEYCPVFSIKNVSGSPYPFPASICKFSRFFFHNLCILKMGISFPGIYLRYPANVFKGFIFGFFFITL